MTDYKELPKAEANALLRKVLDDLRDVDETYGVPVKVSMVMLDMETAIEAEPLVWLIERRNSQLGFESAVSMLRLAEDGKVVYDRDNQEWGKEGADRWVCVSNTGFDLTTEELIKSFGPIMLDTTGKGS